MCTYLELCTAWERKSDQRGQQQKDLIAAVGAFKKALAQDLGLEGRSFEEDDKNLPYVSLGKPDIEGFQMCSPFDLPIWVHDSGLMTVSFKLAVVLERGEKIFPKHRYYLDCMLSLNAGEITVSVGKEEDLKEFVISGDGNPEKQFAAPVAEYKRILMKGFAL